MKTHSNLWSQFVSRENFAAAVVKSLQKKKKTAAIRRFLARPAERTERLRQLVVRGEYKTSPYRVKTIHEPKQRDIYVLPFYPDRIVHHALMNILTPIWDKMFIADSYACRVGKGTHAASRRCMEFVRRNKYFLQCDIRKFYPTINHARLSEIVHRKIADAKLLGVLDEIIGSVGGEINLPIGNLCSQWLGNLYLNELDAFVKQRLRVADYLRYCDDFILFSDDKKLLRAWRDEIRDFLERELCQHFSFAEIAPVSAGVDFLGYRHFPKVVLMRKSTIARFKRRFRAIARVADKTTPRIVGQLAALRGWMMHARTGGRGPPF
jgi:retron-type reverse transcriptase